jgi:putative DNA primase/helicase
MTEAENDIIRQVRERVAQEQAATISGDGTDDGKPSSKLTDECLFANEYGDGVLFAFLFRNKFLYCKNFNEWYEWAGHSWRRDVMNRSLAAVEKVVECYLDEYRRLASRIDETIQNDGDDSGKVKKLKEKQHQLLKRASQLRGDKRRTACLKFAHTIENPLAIEGYEFDNKLMLFPCGNGVIDLETGRLRDGRPEDYLSKASPVHFIDIDHPSAVWDKKFLEIMNDDEEMVAYLQRLFGYAITGLTTEKIFPVLWGKGRNGKSLIVETISHVMGPMAGPIQAEMLLSQRFVKSAAGPSPDIMGLKGLRAAFASETDEGNKFSASKVKWFTGTDTLRGRNPHDKHETTFTPTHKLFLLTNSQPHAPANDYAFWERMHLIPFSLSFVNRDPQEHDERRAILDLDRQLLEEASGILAWLVRGCLLWQKHGLDPPRKVTEATEQYRRSEDLLADFIEECLLVEPGAKAKSSDIYSRFQDWYTANIGNRVPSSTWFGKNMSLKFDKNKIDGCVQYHGVYIPGD